MSMCVQFVLMKRTLLLLLLLLSWQLSLLFTDYRLQKTEIPSISCLVRFFFTVLMHCWCCRLCWCATDAQFRHSKYSYTAFRWPHKKKIVNLSRYLSKICWLLLKFVESNLLELYSCSLIRIPHFLLYVFHLRTVKFLLFGMFGWFSAASRIWIRPQSTVKLGFDGHSTIWEPLRKHVTSHNNSLEVSDESKKDKYTKMIRPNKTKLS